MNEAFDLAEKSAINSMRKFMEEIKIDEPPCELAVGNKVRDAGVFSGSPIRQPHPIQDYDLHYPDPNNKPRHMEIMPLFGRRTLLRRDNNRCRFCGQDVSGPPKNVPAVNGVICHLLVRARGGLTNFDNCVTACLSCAKTKAARTPEEAGMAVLPLTHPMFDVGSTELTGDINITAICLYGFDSSPLDFFNPADVDFEEEVDTPIIVNQVVIE